LLRFHPLLEFLEFLIAITHSAYHPGSMGEWTDANGTGSLGSCWHAALCEGLPLGEKNENLVKFRINDVLDRTAPYDTVRKDSFPHIYVFVFSSAIRGTARRKILFCLSHSGHLEIFRFSRMEKRRRGSSWRSRENESR
jgi:hypothetical protein